MKANFTRIAVVLDRSGSMQTCRESTVSGFNEFISAQKKLPGDAKLLLAQFDDIYERVFDKPLQEVPELTQGTFVPRGWTALLDAQGYTIDALGKELEETPEDERPSKVIVVTLTDGGENRSKKYNVEQIAAMIKHQRDVYGWDFVFLGANQDAIKVAATMNIPMQSSLTYAPAQGGVLNTMFAVSNYVGASRSGLHAAFSKEDRVRSMVGNDDADSAKWRSQTVTTGAQK